MASEEDYYKAQGEDALPIRWMALESMEHYRFTLKSDVWSFGIVVFEIFRFALFDLCVTDFATATVLPRMVK